MTIGTASGRAAPLRASSPPDGAARVAPRHLGLRAAPLAWGLAALSTGASAVGLVLLGHNELAWLEGHPADAVNGIVYPVVGALILSRHRRHPIGWLFVAIGLSMATAMIAAQYAFTDLPGTAAAEWVGRWVWVLGVPLIPTAVVLLFPDGRLPSRRWRPVLWAGLAGVALFLPAMAFLPEDEPAVRPNPLAIPELEVLLEVAGIAGFALLGVGSLGALGSLVVRYRATDRMGRLQLRWFFVAAALVVLTMVLSNVIPLVGPVLQLVAYPLIALATAAAILRYRLYGIDSVISTSLLWGGLSACLLGGYVAVAALVGGLLPSEATVGPALVATAAVAVAFQPLRARLQAGVDRLVYGDRTDPARGLRRLGARLEDTIVLEAILPTVVETVADALRVPSVKIELLHGDVWVRGARHGTPSGSPLQLPLSFGGETLGRLAVYPREPGEAFSRADRQLLEDLARQAGVAVRAVQVTTALQRSREQLLAALENERRRIHRDLHDGLGPSMAALSLGLAAARNLRASHPDEADALLRQLEVEITDVVGDLRRLVEGLRPPQLDELGLAGALVERATALSSPAMSVSVEVPKPLPELPAATEVAAYRIVNEVITNAVRHSGGHRCTVRLTCGQALLLDIQDDGTGLAPDHHPGNGLRILTERARELGGTVEVTAVPPRGTHVLAALPLEQP